MVTYIVSRTVSKLLQIIGQICAFGAPFSGLGATYDVHPRLIGKLVGDFLLVIIELFSLGSFVLSQYTRMTDGRTDGQTDGQTDRISTAIPWVYGSHSRTVKTSENVKTVTGIKKLSYR